MILLFAWSVWFMPIFNLLYKIWNIRFLPTFYKILKSGTMIILGILLFIDFSCKGEVYGAEIKAREIHNGSKLIPSS